MRSLGCDTNSGLLSLQSEAGQVHESGPQGGAPHAAVPAQATVGPAATGAVRQHPAKVRVIDILAVVFN